MAKRKLNAGPATPAAPEASDAGPGIGGMWGGSAMNLLKQRLADTRESMIAAIMNGTVALELDPEQIEDRAGTDRLGDWQKEPEFKALVENIRRRGQVQPIRVRPLRADWKPQESDPLETSDRFVIQSGRRRLAACEALGIKVRAVIATEAGDKALADLEERFHENTMRKNLSGFEELLSIGLIADALADLTQEEIAARIGVAQGDVSLGRSCAELYDQILEKVDVAKTPKREFRRIIPQIRAGERQGEAPKKTAQPAAEVQGEDLKVSVKPSKSGVAVTIRTGRAVDPDWLARKIADLLNGSE